MTDLLQTAFEEFKNSHINLMEAYMGALQLALETDSVHKGIRRDIIRLAASAIKLNAVGSTASTLMYARLKGDDIGQLILDISLEANKAEQEAFTKLRNIISAHQKELSHD